MTALSTPTILSKCGATSRRQSIRHERLAIAPSCSTDIASANIHVQYYAANTWDPDIKAVLLSGTFANFPWKSRHMLVQDEEAYRPLSEAAMKSLREGHERDALPLRMRRTGDLEEPVTGQLAAKHQALPTALIGSNASQSRS